MRKFLKSCRSLFSILAFLERNASRFEWRFFPQVGLASRPPFPRFPNGEFTGKEMLSTLILFTPCDCKISKVCYKYCQLCG